MKGSCIRIGLIGLGWIGSHHGHNAIHNPSVELVAVADPQSDVAQVFLQRECTQAQIFTDYEQLLTKADVDAVIIASPNAKHAEQAVAAAQAGKHIYLEKPMAITLEDCRRVAKAVEKNRVICTMGYHRRFNPLAQYARKLLDEDKLGALVMAESDYFHHIPGDLEIWKWLGKEDIAGSLLHSGNGHNIDLLRYFCGEVVEVSCFKAVRMPRQNQVETEDIAIINLRFENGVMGRVGLFIGPVVPFTFTFRLYGTRGSIIENRIWLDTFPCFDQPGHEDECITLPRAWIPDNVQGGIAETWAASLSTFIDDVRFGRPSFNSAASGFNTAAVCFAAVQSAATQSVVTPEQWPVATQL